MFAPQPWSRNTREELMAEYYRQECMKSLYSNEAPSTPTLPHKSSRKEVSFAAEIEIIGCADESIDREPIGVSPISQMELLLLLSQRIFPIQS